MAVLLLIAIAWTWIVVLMTAVEALGPGGTLLGALVTFIGYGVLPLSVVLYVGSTGLRRQARLQAEARALAAAAGQDASTSDANPVHLPAAGAEGAASAADDPGGRGHAAGAPLASEREEA